MQNKNPKISVIMPVYNVEEYLKKAIESVTNQSFSNFELFLVDDGSTDNSGEICDTYAKTDKRIKVIHQKNSGAHNARNNALKLSSGEYVCFFDSDDYIDPNMLKEMYEIAKNYNSDLVVSGFNINTYYNENDFIVLKYTPCTKNSSQIEHFSNKELFRKYAYLNFDRNMFYPPWNKLYKLSYIYQNNITFPNTYRDDFPFVLNVIKDIENVTYVTKHYYNFIRKRTESETQKYVSNLYEKREEEHEEMMKLYKYWKLDNDSNSIEMISRRYIDRIIECIVNLFNGECKLTSIEKKQKIKLYLNTDNFNKSIILAKPKNLYLRIIYLILKFKNIEICYIMSQFINFVKRKNIKFFSVLKANR